MMLQKPYITIDNPLDWSILSVGLEKRICSSFEGCLVPMYECLVSMLGVRLPFSDFEVAFMYYLKVAPSHFHPRATTSMKVFQLCVEY